MIAIGFGLAVVLLAIIGFLSFLNTRRLLEATRSVDHTQEVLKHLDNVRSAVVDAETGRRGFVITHDERQLDAYENGARAFGPELDTLSALITDNAQQRRLAALRPLVVARFALLAESIDLARLRPEEMAAQIDLTVKGKDASDAVLGAIGELRTEESRLLAERRSAAEAPTRRTVVTSFGGLLASIALLTLVFTLLRKEVSERRRAEIELEMCVAVSLEMLCIAGFDGYFKRLYPEWERVLGFTAAELCAVPYLDFVHPDDRASTVAESGKLTTSGVRTIKFHNRYRCKDGSYRWLVWNATPDMENRLLYAAARDVTAERAAGEEIGRLSHELARRVVEVETVNKELEAFSYSVSHDLQAPLRAMDGFSQAVLEDYGPALDERGRGYLGRIRAAATRMGSLINDLLDLARVTRAEMKRGRVDLSALAAEVVIDLRRAEPERAIEVEVAPDLAADGDAELLRAVLTNLLGNAWKFTSRTAAPRIVFAADGTRDGRPVYFVRDNGAGFDMGHADRLFGPFQRLHPTADFPGTGVGLATVQRIIRRHGGDVWADASPGRGATFYFTI